MQVLQLLQWQAALRGRQAGRGRPRLPSSILRRVCGKLTPMRRPTAEMPLRMAVSILFIMLLGVSGTPCKVLATSLQHVRDFCSHTLNQELSDGSSFTSVHAGLQCHDNGAWKIILNNRF